MHWQLDAAPFCDEVGEVFGALFLKKVPFLANTGCYPTFLDYALQGHQSAQVTLFNVTHWNDKRLLCVD